MSEIRQLTINNRVLGIVEVPTGFMSTTCELTHNEYDKTIPVLFYGVQQIYGGDAHNFSSTHKHFEAMDLPPGDWRILGLAGQLTEEQAGEIVENWQSLCRKEGIKPNELIIIRDEN